MAMRTLTARRTAAALAVSTLLLSASAAVAQKGRNPTTAFGTLRAALEKLDLTAEQKQAIDDTLKAGQADLKAAVADAQHAPADQRAVKAAAVQKQFDDLVVKVEGEMPEADRPKFERARAGVAVEAAKDGVESIRAAAAAAEMSDDERAKVKAAFAEMDKVLDGSKVDAAEAKRPQDASDVQLYVNQAAAGLQKGVVDALGRDRAIAIFKDAAGRTGK